MSHTGCPMRDLDECAEVSVNNHGRGTGRGAAACGNRPFRTRSPFVTGYPGQPETVVARQVVLRLSVLSATLSSRRSVLRPD